MLLASVDELSKAQLKQLHDIFADEKIAKQVLNAAKRVTKKRAAPDAGVEADSSKKVRRGASATSNWGREGAARTPFEIESSLELPSCDASEDELMKTTIQTNRAPLVLAFAVCVLRHTMPAQPISSRLSLAQAVVSANSRSKAVSIGLETGKSAEDEGWGRGQPTIRVLGRDIAVLKRWDYDPREDAPPTQQTQTSGANRDGSQASEATITASPERPTNSEIKSDMPPLWGLDLEALRRSNDPHSRKDGTHRSNHQELPIHTAESARSYLLRSFTFVQQTESETEESSSKKRRSGATLDAEREKALAMLLQAIDLLCQSWASTLPPDELDRRAWSWYVHVRPDVRTGVAGWGEKGHVKLADILALRRNA
jgi:hypothetical protein